MEELNLTETMEEVVEETITSESESNGLGGVLAGLALGGLAITGIVIGVKKVGKPAAKWVKDKFAKNKIVYTQTEPEVIDVIETSND